MDDGTGESYRISLRSRDRRDHVLVYWSDNGEMGYSGTVTIKVVSRGKPVIIDGEALRSWHQPT